MRTTRARQRGSHDFYTTNPMVFGAIIVAVSAFVLGRLAERPPQAGDWVITAAVAGFVGLMAIGGYSTSRAQGMGLFSAGCSSLTLVPALGGAAWWLRASERFPLLKWVFLGLAGACVLALLVELVLSRLEKPQP